MTKITKTKRGFQITHTPCVVCKEPPFGGEYCCGHSQICAKCRVQITSMNHVIAHDGGLYHQRCWNK